MKPKRLPPRGIRNCNPLNIRIGNTWLGEVPSATDSDFEQFVSMRYGLRAAFCILRRYIRRYNRNTIEKIIRAWAPASENDTAAYIQQVSARLNMQPDEVIRYEDEETMCRLVAAMALVENGQPVAMDDIIQGYNMA